MYCYTVMLLLLFFSNPQVWVYIAKSVLLHTLYIYRTAWRVSAFPLFTIAIVMERRETTWMNWGFLHPHHPSFPPSWLRSSPRCAMMLRRHGAHTSISCWVTQMAHVLCIPSASSVPCSRYYDSYCCCSSYHNSHTHTSYRCKLKYIDIWYTSQSYCQVANYCRVTSTWRFCTGVHGWWSVIWKLKFLSSEHPEQVLLPNQRCC